MCHIRQGRCFPLFLPPQSRATQGREQRQLSPTQLDSNTRAGVEIPSLRNSPWRREKGSHCRSPGHDCNEDKKATKRLHFKSMKSTRSCCAQARDTVQGSSGRGSVAHSVLASPLMQGVGASQPQEQPQEHREGSQGPWGQGVPQLCSPDPSSSHPCSDSSARAEHVPG